MNTNNTNNPHDALLAYGGTRFALTSPRQTLMAQPWHPVAAGLVGLVAPLVVLILLRRRAVREYFNPTE